jgi:hypothetical protein
VVVIVTTTMVVVGIVPGAEDSRGGADVCSSGSTFTKGTDDV